MNFIRENIYKFVFTFLILVAPFSLLYGQTISGTNCPPGKICNPLGAGTADIPSFIRTVLTGLLKIGIPLVALAVIYCGFLFVAARGNAEKLSKAKDALLYTLVGAGILLGSWSIAELIKSTVEGLGT